jgi:pSer/pThr/pTyr-binding forkhead associated (FHA) protein/outer membrane biosynthesis protein TonB
LKPPVILRIFKASQLIEVKQFDLDQIVIGNRAEVSIDLDDRSVAPIHAMIELRDSGYYVCDLGSASGTLKNGEPILDEPISSGDEIGVGPFRLVFYIGVPKPKMAPPSARAPGESTSASIRVVQEPPVATSAQEPPATSSPAQQIETPLSIASELSSVKITLRDPSENTNAKPVAKESNEKSTPVVEHSFIKKPQPQSQSADAVAAKKQAEKAKQSEMKKHHSFAPPSDIQDLKEFLNPQKGNTVEVLVAWKERVIDISHFRNPTIVKINDSSEHSINLPANLVPAGIPFIDIKKGTMRVLVPDGLSVEIVNKSGTISFEELKASQRATALVKGYSISVDQLEMAIISFPSNPMKLIVRWIPDSPIAHPGPIFEFTAGEISGMVMAIVAVALLATYVSIYAPMKQEQIDQLEEVKTVAQFIYKKPPEPPPPPKKVEVDLSKKDEKKPPKVPAKPKPAKQALEVAAKPPTDKPKDMTSVKQGGATATGQAMGANANSQPKKDISKMGLFSAFGTGGVRESIDAAYSGSGDALGLAATATGKSGVNENRDGKDLGYDLKDTGAGGAGTATVGIAGVGTKGRSTGQNEYGTANVGEKGGTEVKVGGQEEEFTGTIDKEAVRRVVRAGNREVRGCYERELNKNPNLEGKVVLEWEIGEAGKVLKVRVKTSTIGNAELESCMMARLQSWRFPEPPSGLTAVVQYPFMLMNQK